MEVDVIERFMLTLWNDKQLSSIGEVFSSDAIIHSPLGDYIGPRAFTDVVRSWIEAFPDIHVTPLHSCQEGDTVIIHWVSEATHLGDFKGVPASSRRVRYHGITFHRLEDGKVKEYWANVDMFSLLQQLTGERIAEPALV